MSIANELSSDVAAAVLARNKGSQIQAETQELFTLLINFHTALRSLTIEERRRRLRLPLRGSEAPSQAKQSAAGN